MQINVGDYFLVDDDEWELYGIMKVTDVGFLDVTFISLVANEEFATVPKCTVQANISYRKLKFDE